MTRRTPEARRQGKGKLSMSKKLAMASTAVLILGLAGSPVLHGQDQVLNDQILTDPILTTPEPSGSTSAEDTPDPKAGYIHTPYQVMSLDKDKLSHIRTYCLFLEGGSSNYPAHDAIALNVLRQQAQGTTSLFAKMTGLKYVPRCSAADASVSVYIMREKMIPGEGDPASFHMTVGFS
jgi:hypothetical protein